MATINTNMSANIASNSMVRNERTMTSTMERLSTGLRINSAKDDAAGLAISSKMTSQIRGLDQAVRNANDAISMIQVAEGAMKEVTSMFLRMRELAVQAISDSNTNDDRTALNNEHNQRSQEVKRIASNTQWNGTNILDGARTNSVFQIGANANQRIAVNFGDLSNNSVTAAVGPSSAAAMTADATALGTFGTGVFEMSDGTNGIHIDQSSVNAGDAAGLELVIKQATQVAALYTSGVDLAPTMELSASRKVVFSFGGASAEIDLFSASANDGSGGNAFQSGLLHHAVLAMNAALDAAGINFTAGQYTGVADAGFAFTADDGTDADGYILTANNPTVTVDGSASTVVEHTVGSDAYAGLGSTVAADTAGTGLLINYKSTNKGAVSLPTILNNTVAKTAAVVTAGVDTGIASSSLATSALGVLDTAIENVNSTRATLGASMSRLEHAADNLQNVSQNSSAARSRVLDADYASETKELARTQIILQASTAMLSQANQSQ
jgi:flagellin